jgi:hypothetical protein
MSALDLEVLRKGRPEGAFEAEGRPDQPAYLQSLLRSWLSGNGWAEGRWGEFEMLVRETGRNKVLAKIRA